MKATRLRSPHSVLQRLWLWLLCGAVGLTGLLTALVWAVGQEHFVVAPFAYLPRMWPGLVILMVAAMGWRWNQRAMSLGLGCGLFYLLVVLEWRTPRPARPSPEALRVVAVNVGDQDEGSWNRWIGDQQPDLIAICEMVGHRIFQKEGPEVAGLPHLYRAGPFALASRYPIRSSRGIFPRPESPGGLVLPSLPAARFEVELPAGPIVVYVIHLRSPRTVLRRYTSLEKWKYTLGGRKKDQPLGWTLSHYWTEQRTALDRVLDRIRQETLPTLVLGDWNVPDSGPRYRELVRGFLDAHREAGTGYGYTFPGDVKHWAAFHRPWMRIDYILAERGEWEVLDCRVQEDAADSQHRAVVADLRMK